MIIKSVSILQLCFILFLLCFKVLCTAVALTINYFYLVAFGWMVAEGVMLYLKVVKVFNVMTTTKYFYGFAWGKSTWPPYCKQVV